MAVSQITLPGHHKRRVATYLHSLRTHHGTLKPTNFARVVCISDTHNRQPILPHGDIPIHAGDLTDNGSFAEVQTGLDWLNSQPHTFKILIAGNHDVLLDEVFLTQHPSRRYQGTRTRADLNWGDVIYLEDSSVSLVLSVLGVTRRLSIYGSPWTPRYGISAFQYTSTDEDHWSSRFAEVKAPDVVVTHGPPRFHLDRAGIHRAGCPYLAEEIARVRPRLVVFGHIHASYGREDIVLDRVQRLYEEVMVGWVGWAGIVWMAVSTAWNKAVSWTRAFDRPKVTTFVNASIVGGATNEIVNEPIIVDL